jgi:hypothetical protein
VTKTTIESGWIIQHKEAIPWSLFVGARILMNSGQYLVLQSVTVRSWPAGPLLEVSYVESGKPKLCTYNFQAFSSGLLRDIEVGKTLADEIESLTSVLEVKLKEKTLAERDRKVAEEALMRLAIEEKHAHFLRTKGLINHGVQAANTFKPKRVTHCYSCKSQLDNQVDIECSACQWIICTCGACGCGWTPRDRY